MPVSQQWTQTDMVARSLASPPGALRGRRLMAARAVWVAMSALVVGLAIATLPVAYSEYSTVCVAGSECRPYWRLAPQDVGALRDIGLSVGFYAGYSLAAEIISMLGFWMIGAVIFWRRSDDRLALFFSLMLVAFGALGVVDKSAAVHPALGQLGAFVVIFGYVSFFVSFFVFPDGRFVPRWARPLVLVWALYVAALYLAPNDSAFHPSAWSPLLVVPLVLGLFGSVVFAQIYRYLRVSGPVERQQTKWVVSGLTAAIFLAAAMAVPAALSSTLLKPGVSKVFYTLAEATVVSVAMLLIPLSLGIAILRYRLWDIDVIINRALVFGALTAVVIGVYVLVVGGLGSILQERGSFLLSLLAAGLVAVIFAPLRERLQRGVNRLMYGERDDPYAVLSRLGRRLDAALEPGTVFPTIVETVAGALKLPYAAIELKRRDGYEVAAVHGVPTGEQTILPLSYGGETVGRLVLAPRAPGESFSPADRSLLEDLARNAEVAAHAVRLTADLQRSRERLVSAREEERRRLRRDLHDGLGPTLASLGLGIDVSLKILDEEPEEAEAILRQLKGQTKEAVMDIRRLVYDLRPPALDDLGLIEAIREQAANQGLLASELASGGARRNNGLVFDVEAPKELPPLSAAVEVACYRIVQEAITNVVRHARASTCRVRLAVNEASRTLEMEVSDDGVGMPANRKAGVGLSSMAERADELGGRLVVESSPEGGTRVLAMLPLLTKEEGQG